MGVFLQQATMSLNNQNLDYKAILDLCEIKMMSIKFLWICKESMISVENLEIEKWRVFLLFFLSILYFTSIKIFYLQI